VYQLPKLTYEYQAELILQWSIRNATLRLEFDLDNLKSQYPLTVWFIAEKAKGRFEPYFGE